MLKVNYKMELHLQSVARCCFARADAIRELSCDTEERYPSWGAFLLLT